MQQMQKEIQDDTSTRDNIQSTGQIASKATPLLLLPNRLRRPRSPEHTRQIKHTINEQEPRRPNVTPRQGIPTSHVCKGLPSHRQERGVDMPDVCERQADQVVAQHFRLRACV